MKRTIKLAVVAALALGATSAFATNGATMIGYGAKSMGMGGAGIGVSHGAESALANPAMISSVEGFEVSFGGTLFMPDVSSTNGLNLPTSSVAGAAFDPATGAGADGSTDYSGSADSESDMFMIPSVSLAYKVSDDFSWGIGMWGTGGLGVDYRDSAAQMNMVTALQLMQFGVPLVYTADNFSIGLTPILQYGSLDINYVMSADLQNVMYASQMSAFPNPLVTTSKTIGAGVNSDLQFGYTLGLGYETNGLTIGAVYKSEIEMEYDGVLSTAAGAMTNNAYTNDKLSSPAEYGVGISYTTSGHTIALDYKMIDWENAKGYEDFLWESQDVIAVGYEYATDGWAARAGYQYAESAMTDATGYTTGANGLSANTINTFNAIGFPGNMESHVTLGCSYDFSDKVSLDLAYVASLEAKDTYKNFMSQDTTVEHSEDAISFQVNFQF